MSSTDQWQHATAAEVRDAIRRGQWTGPTAGMASGFAQANVVILPAALADEFAEYCRQNPAPCPLIARTAPGCSEPKEVAENSDLRTDVPRYRVFIDGQPQQEQPTDVSRHWRDDLVGFLLGCSFTFERALMDAGHRVRHVELGLNVPMYRTNRPCTPVGPFAGGLVVSMRPFPAKDVDRVREITAQYPLMHGPPVHDGDPTELGIADLSRPDFGDAVEVRSGEVPVFWACGVTSQLAVAAARPDLSITHSPGAMFIMDRRDEEFCEPVETNQ